MGAAKEGRNLLGLLLVKLFRPLGDAAWVAIASVMCALVLLIGSIYLWDEYGEQILGQSKYRLHRENLTVTEQPEWIRSDITKDALVRGRLDGELLSDHTLSPRIARAFLSNPWVEEVRLVNKTQAAQGKIAVDLSYRRPVAVVEVPAGSLPHVDFESLLPVDVNGRLLPTEEFTQEEANQFPRISAVDTLPVGTLGEPWGDVRVADAAKIADTIGDLWGKLSLYRIEVPRQAEVLPSGAGGSFNLVTRGGDTIPWGSAAGREAPTEPTAAEKIEMLKRYLEEEGPLDGAISQVGSDEEFQLTQRRRRTMR